MKLRIVSVQSKKKPLWISVKENLLSIGWEMYAGVSEEPKKIRSLPPADIRYEYPVPLPQLQVNKSGQLSKRYDMQS